MNELEVIEEQEFADREAFWLVWGPWVNRLQGFAIGVAASSLIWILMK